MANESAVENDEVQKPKSKVQQDRESWEAYWKVLDIETKGNPLKRLRYYAWLAMDKPSTWFRGKSSCSLQCVF